MKRLVEEDPEFYSKRDAKTKATKVRNGHSPNWHNAKKVLEKVLAKLNEFINGVGWKCTINDYVLDHYSRHLVNKALEHGLDVSRSSDFVNELASRLSNVSGRKPTRSDLATYAKREGLDTKS